jgi:hypothetical protein
MPRKGKNTEAAAGNNPEHYLAYLGYNLGYADIDGPAFAAWCHRAAEPGERVPPGLDLKLEGLKDLVSRLAPLLPEGAQLADQVAQRVMSVKVQFKKAWPHSSPLVDEAWMELQLVLTRFIQALPSEVMRWVRLAHVQCRSL